MHELETYALLSGPTDNHWLVRDEATVPHPHPYPKNKSVSGFISLVLCINILLIVVSVISTLLPRPHMVVSLNGGTAKSSNVNHFIV